MGRFFSYFSTIILLALIFVGAFWFYFAPSELSPLQSIRSLSPLPDFLTLKKNAQVRLLDLWFPSNEGTLGISDMPEITAQSVFMYDLTSNKALYEKNARERMPMASLTKIMTAIIALENPQEDDRYRVRAENIVGENSMGLTAGEELSLEKLLYGLLLPSGNDAAETLASHYLEGREAFIQAMNDKARALGLTDTHFTNPSGLEGDGDQHTTAYDLLVITRYALENFPQFRKIVATASYSIGATSTHSAYELSNDTNLLTTYPGVKGIKTGYTPEAGLCLVTYLDYKGHRIIGIVLNSQNRRGEMKELLDYSLKTLGVTPPEFKGEI